MVFLCILEKERKRKEGTLMSQVCKVYGVLIVHKLDNAQFRYVADGKQLILLGELELSDQAHHIAAHLIAREYNFKVVWHDISGQDHVVLPTTKFELFSSEYDPRDHFLQANTELYSL